MPAKALPESGAELLHRHQRLAFRGDKRDERASISRVTRVKESGLPLLYVNQVGGQDELVFDGALLRARRRWRSARAGAGLARGADHDALDARRPAAGRSTKARGAAERGDRLSSIYQAMVLGLSDYVRKNNFPGVVLGLSGGIDSALTRGGRGRCARRRQGALRDDAVALYLARQSRRRGGGRARLLGMRAARDRYRPGDGGLSRDAGAVLRRPRARHHRGKPASRAPAA